MVCVRSVVDLSADNLKKVQIPTANRIPLILRPPPTFATFVVEMTTPENFCFAISATQARCIHAAASRLSLPFLLAIGSVRNVHVTCSDIMRAAQAVIGNSATKN